MLRHKYLIAVALVLLTAGLVAAVLYIQSRPTVLKIAVGPRASEDLRLAQSLAQYLVARARKNPAARHSQGYRGRERGSAGEGRSRTCSGAARLRNAQERSGDRDPSAQCRSADRAATAGGRQEQGQGKIQGSQEGRQADRKDRGSVRQDRRHRRPHARQSDICSTPFSPNMALPADKVNKVQISTEDLTTQLKTCPLTRCWRSARSASKITAEAVTALAARGKAAAEISGSRLFGSDRAAEPGLSIDRNTGRRLRRVAPCRERGDHRRLPLHRRAPRSRRKDRRRFHQAAVRGQAVARRRSALLHQDRKPGYRQGCNARRASGCARLSRRRAKDLLRALQRAALLGSDAVVVLRLRRRLACKLCPAPTATASRTTSKP